MESLQKLRKQQTESHMMLTLNKQIEALTPIRVSYQNLVNYHQKVTIDLASLIEEHDYALSSLKSNLQNLAAISLRTETEKNDLTIELKDRQNDLAKLVLDTRNLAQKYESLNQKLELQGNRTQQNFNYKAQLQKIQQTLKNHIANTQAINIQLQNEQQRIKENTAAMIENIQKEEIKRQQLLNKSEIIKSQIAKMNVQNDDMVDGNRKLNEEIKLNQDQYKAKGRLNRELKEKLIEQKSMLEKIKNQIQYTMTLQETEDQSTLQLKNHQAKIDNLITDAIAQKQLVNNQNNAIESEVNLTEKTIQESLNFKLKAENHLTELKQTNELLLNKMEQCCMQDKQIENLLMKKMVTLEFFAKKLHEKYESQQNIKLITSKKQTLLSSPTVKDSFKFDSFEQKLYQFQKKESSNSTQKSWKK